MSATIRERQKECNTLVSLLTGTVGHTVTVELRNETKVTGILPTQYFFPMPEMYLAMPV